MSELSNVRLAGIANAVPEYCRPVTDEAHLFGERTINKFSQTTGVDKRHLVPQSMCASDLCFEAAERLLADLDWPRDSVDALIFVSQTPDYVLPATSCVLHKWLGLAKHCAAFDLSLGCSGYVYGLWIASQLVAGGGSRRVLLLVGDTSSRIVSPYDQATALLFGDAGSATALEYAPHAPPMFFSMCTDGAGQDHLIVTAGGFRNPHTEQTGQRTERENGAIRSDEDLFMDGAEVFSFTLREVPALIEAVLSQAGWSAATTDAFVMHQANKFIIGHIARRLRLPLKKVMYSIKEYGNTSSASIPLTMTHTLTENLQQGRMKLLLVGYGVGFSWGGVALTCGPLVMPEMIYVSEPEPASEVV